jgi:hypothetical protein
VPNIQSEGKTPSQKRQYRKGRREPVRLGVGLFATRQDIRDTARIDFLLEVRDCAPNVLQYLKREVFPFADTQKFEACLSEWASVHNLPADWVIDIGRKTVKKWKRQPSTLERNKLDWAGLSLSSAIRAELSNEQTMIHLPTLSWNPQYPPPTLKKVSESQLKRQPDWRHSSCPRADTRRDRSGRGRRPRTCRRGPARSAK